MMISRIYDKAKDVYLCAKSRFDPCPFGSQYQKYWIRRKEIFSKWDQGIRTDAVGLFSATPEKIADDIAKNVKAKTIIDAFCGIGATTIAFARVCDKAFAVDINQDRLDMAKHNAEIYGVKDKIEFICGDIFETLHKVSAAAIFLDPPWGGVDYSKLEEFKLKDFNPDGNKLLEESFKRYQEIILRVPRQFVLAELDRYQRPYRLQDNRLRSKLYSRTIYFS